MRGVVVVGAGIGGLTESAVLARAGVDFAVAGRCPHLGAPLTSGQITGEGFLVCPWHHSAFNPRTGDVASWTPWRPGVGRVLGALRREHALPVFPVKVETGRVWVGV